QFFLCAALGLLALLFLPLHFLLTLLECNGHIASLKLRVARAISEKLLRRLPARFAWLPGRLAVILIGKSAPASSTPAASWRPCGVFRASFIYLQIAPANSLGGLFIVGHFHERKPSRAPRLAIFHQVHAGDLPKRLEQFV